MTNTLNAEMFSRGYLEDIKQIIGNMDVGSIAKFVSALLDASRRGSNIFFFGNGGSATTASHFANDIAYGHHASLGKPFRAVSLTDNAAIVTALANDFGYDDIFVRQLAVQMVPSDVVVAISASGNSVNAVRAVEYANLHDAITVALTGFDGGRLRKIANISVHVPTEQGNYGHTEDIHMMIDHLVSAYILKEYETEVNERTKDKNI